MGYSLWEIMEFSAQTFLCQAQTCHPQQGKCNLQNLELHLQGSTDFVHLEAFA